MSENLKAVMTPETEEQVRQEISVLVSNAQSLVIKTEQENTAALTLTANYKAEIKRRKAMDVYVKAEESKRSATSAFKALVELMIDPLTDSVDIIVQKVGQFTKAENLRRAEIQRQEDERVAAAQRKEDERVAEIQRKAAAANKPPPVITPKFIPPARTVAAVSAPAGTSLPTRWSAKVVDPMLFLQAVLAGEEPITSIEILLPVYNAKATAIKKENAEIAPGIIAVSKIGAMSR